MYNKDHAVYPVLQAIGKEITQKVKPKAVVVFSAHWQAKPNLIQLNNAVDTDLIYESVAIPAFPLGELHRSERAKLTDMTASTTFLISCTKQSTPTRATWRWPVTS